MTTMQGDGGSSRVMKTMIGFSLAMVTCPIFSYFFSKSWIFEGIFGLSDSYFYAAIVSIVVVHIILGGFIYVAWNEDSKPIPQFKVD